MYKLYLVCAVTACMLLSLPLAANADTQPEVTILVTAEMLPQLASQSIASATVITAKDMEEQGAIAASDAVQLVPGVMLRQSGQPGSAATVYIRGAKSNQVLVLVDGQRLSSPAFFSGTDLSKYPVEDIARIEVIRGPASCLYGSEAIGGVINIITKRNTEPGGEASAGYGSNGRQNRRVSLRGTAGPAKFRMSADSPRYDGTRPNSDFAASNVTGAVDIPLFSGWETTLKAERYCDELGLPGPAIMVQPPLGGPLVMYNDLDDRQWWDRSNVGITFTRPQNSGELVLRTYQMDQQLHNVAPGTDWIGDPVVYDSLIKGKTRVSEFHWGFEQGKHRTIVGAETRTDDYDDLEEGPSPSHQIESITNNAFYAQDRWRIGNGTDMVYGARLDNHSTAGSKVTPRVGITTEIKPGSRLRASYSEGFRAPNFVELYYPEGPWGPGYSGNPDLEPEKSKQYEIGFNSTQGDDSFDFAIFHTSTRDLIQATSSTPYENIGSARQQGLEFTWEHRLPSSARVALSCSYIDAMNLTTGERLNGIPQTQASLSVAKRSGSWDITLTGHMFGSIPDLSFNPVTYESTPVTLPGRAIFDISLIGNAGGVIRPYIIIRNVTDTTYELVADYPSEGFSIEAGINSVW